MKLCQASPLIVYLLICTFGLAEGRQCSPSSCGQLKEIKDPFRLKGDPSECGDPRFELTCNANRTTWETRSGMYFLKSISYVNWTIRITDVRLAGGGCALPNHSISPSTVFDEFRSTSVLQSVIIFVNCTQRVQDYTYYSETYTDYSQNYIYTPIPCLSENNSFVYTVFYDKDDLSFLKPSCRIIATTPFMYDGMDNLTEERIFQRLKNGFLISWRYANCKPAFVSAIHSCFRTSYRLMVEDYEYALEYGNLFYWIRTLPLSFNNYFFECLDQVTYDNDDLVDYEAICALNNYTFRLVEFLILLLYVVVVLVLPRLVGRFIFAPLAFVAFLAYKYWESQVPIDDVEKFLLNQQSLTPTRYTYPDIIAMTRHFKDKLGQGGFGSVYKGELPGGFQVAVKILGNSKCNGDDFISEVSTIGMIHHVNVVRLVGYCSEGSKRALIYEYLPKGSLDKYIFTSDGAIQRPFTWDKLNDIALDVARGIDYLHRGCDMRILHFDIKPHNILLDNCFNPKVSDFGLAKLFPRTSVW